MPLQAADRSSAHHASSIRLAERGSKGADPSTLYETHFAFVWRNLQRLGVAEAQLEDAA
jgi:hypothetical protein